MVDGGPEFVFGGRSVGICRDEEDLMLSGLAAARFAISEAGGKFQGRSG